MDTLNIDRIRELLEQGDVDGARSLLRKVIDAPLSDKEKGGIYVEFARVYLEVMNRINERYEKVLDETIAQLKEINKDEAAAIKDIDLKRLKHEIKKEPV
jgi:hypothetical protein